MRSRIRALLLLLLLCTILLEGLALLRAPLTQSVHRAYPQVGLDEEGRVLYFDVRFEEGPDGGIRPVWTLDEARNAAETVPIGFAEDTVRHFFRGPGLWSGGRIDLEHPRFLRDLWRRDEFVPYTPLEALVRNVLDATERRRRSLPDDVPGSGEPVRPPVEWHVEGNRLVCRETANGRVVAGLGPDGYTRGEHADDGPRFGRIAVGPIRMTPGVSTRTSDWVPMFLFDRDARRIHVLSVAKEEAGIPPDSTEPLPLTIETRPLRPCEAGEAVIGTWPYASVVDRHVLVFLEDGTVIADLEIEPDEGAAAISNALVVQSEGRPGLYVMTEKRQRPPIAAVGLQTALDPSAPGDERRRLRLFRPGQPPIVHDILLTPTRPTEVALANLVAAFALLRPPPLVVASALSPLPTSGRERWWWWRDVWLAGGSYIGCLILSLALAGFLAWRARRAARERCATARAVRFWTAAVFLLGPVGLLWMKLVLPRVPVEPVGQSRRAVNLDASPSTSTPWPDPKPLGIEVIS